MPPTLFLLLLHTSQLSSPAPHPSLLPLLLPFPAELSRIRAYHQPSDTLLALGSCLLKHLAVVRGMGVKWEESRLGRREGVEGGKPCFLGMGVVEDRGGEEKGEGEGMGMGMKLRKQKQIDFNTSHHGQVVVLVAATTTTTITTPLDPAAAAATIDPETAHAQSEQPSPSPSTSPTPTIKVGIDVVQTTSPSGLRGYAREGWKGWVNIFSEIFSAGELASLLDYQPSASPSPFSPSPSLDSDPLQTPRLRLFYTYWALKEAYLKMIGLGVVAPWVQELEFRNVRAPDVGVGGRAGGMEDTVCGQGQVGKEERVRGQVGKEEEGVWGPVLRGVEVWRAGQRVRGVRVEVRGWGTEYVVATVVEGMGGWEGEGEDEGGGERDGKGEQGFPAFEEVVVERDILPFARDKGD